MIHYQLLFNSVNFVLDTEFGVLRNIELFFKASPDKIIKISDVLSLLDKMKEDLEENDSVKMLMFCKLIQNFVSCLDEDIELNIKRNQTTFKLTSEQVEIRLERLDFLELSDDFAASTA